MDVGRVIATGVSWFVWAVTHLTYTTNKVAGAALAAGGGGVHECWVGGVRGCPHKTDSALAQTRSKERIFYGRFL